MVFVFYQFNSSPLHFNPAAVKDVMASPYAQEYQDLVTEKMALDEQLITKQLRFTQTEDASEKALLKEEIQIINITEDELREQSKAVIKKANPDAETNDKDYVFVHFILENLPRGLIGLLLAVILSAAMSSTASELNALGSTTTMDLYARNVTIRDDKHHVRASKWFTLLWGVLAILVACFANLFDNLIQLVNIIGSIFYGNILGVFLLAFFFKYIKGNAVFVAALINQALVIALYLMDEFEIINLPYLWLNFVGCVTVMAIAFMLQAGASKNNQEETKNMLN
jgi:Na+/proline symporter